MHFITSSWHLNKRQTITNHQKLACLACLGPWDPLGNSKVIPSGPAPTIWGSLRWCLHCLHADSSHSSPLWELWRHQSLPLCLLQLALRRSLRRALHHVGHRVELLPLSRSQALSAPLPFVAFVKSCSLGSFSHIPSLGPTNIDRRRIHPRSLPPLDPFSNFQSPKAMQVYHIPAENIAKYGAKCGMRKPSFVIFFVLCVVYAAFLRKSVHHFNFAWRSWARSHGAVKKNIKGICLCSLCSLCTFGRGSVSTFKGIWCSTAVLGSNLFQNSSGTTQRRSELPGA